LTQTNLFQRPINMNISYKLLASVTLLALTSTMATAQEQVVRHHDFDTTQVDRLILDFRVGTIHLESSTSDRIEVELVIRQENSRRLFRRSPDIQSMDLTHRSNQDTLRLSFDENNVRTDWIIRLPALAYLEIDAGVGTIDGDLPPGAVDINLGVGAVDLVAQRASTGAIDLDARVGDTSLSGLSDNKGGAERRALVSSTSSGHGRGDHRVRIRVGVGDVSLHLQ